MVKINWFWITATLILGSFSCSDSGVMYQKAFDLPEQGWAYQNILEDSWVIGNQATQPYIVLNVHIAPYFGYQNLYLNTNWTHNSALIISDTFSIQLTDPRRGGWLGAQKGDHVVVSDTIPLPTTLNPGDSIAFQLSQFSREDQLEGIQAIEVVLRK